MTGKHKRMKRAIIQFHYLNAHLFSSICDTLIHFQHPPKKLFHYFSESCDFHSGRVLDLQKNLGIYTEPSEKDLQDLLKRIG